ncbi:MAG TPA: PAS domain-containing sensor histidine kinase [Thermoanaerobaculia bacterium]
MKEELRAVYLDQLYQGCAMAAALTDTRRRILSTNRAFEQLFERSQGELCGKDLLGLLAPAGRQEVRDTLERSKRQSPVSCESIACKSESEGVAVSLTVVPVASGGRLRGYCLLLLDLTARKNEERIQRWFVDQVIRAQEEERRRIARELHDQTGQSVAALVVRLVALLDSVDDARVRGALSELLVLAANAADEVRRMARGLRPAALDERGLRTAIEAQAVDFERSHGIKVDLHIAGVDDSDRLSGDLEIAIYRIVQETLTNIARHSGASAVSILMERRDGRLRLIVEDDGTGFPTALPPAAPTGSLGLAGIRERIALLRGTMTIETIPGKGSAVYFEIPIEGAR